MKEKIVSTPAAMQPSWFSYQGVVLGVLKRIGLKVDLIDVIAVSGYGWITNAMRKSLCPSAPSAFHWDMWLENFEATKNLGIDIDIWTIKDGFEWDEEQNPTPESIVNARKQFDDVKKEIDNDRAVVLWGLVIPEYGIVNGYRGEEYIVSTYRSLIKQPDDPQHYTALMSPGGLITLKFGEKTSPDPKKTVHETLKRGYKLGMGEVPKIPEYVIGPDAYDVLAHNLTEEKFDEGSYHGTAYTLSCLQESKGAITDYLRRVDSHIEPSLIEASNNYDTTYKLLKKCQETFPMGTGTLERPKCHQVAELLREAKKAEEKALQELQLVLESL